MKKIIILLLALLMSACSAVKPSETLSSMQTEPTAETTVTETAAPEETTETATKETETVIETPKENPPAPIIIERPEQRSVPDTTTETTEKTTVDPVKTETITKTSKTPAETVKEDKPTELPESVKSPPESVTEPPKAEFDVNYRISFAKSYALQIGLGIDPTQCHPNYTADIREGVAVEYVSCEPTENLREFFPEVYGEGDDSFEEEETEQA